MVGSFTTATTSSVEMTSPLENLYPDTDTSEPFFPQPGLVSYVDPVSHSLPVSVTSHVTPELAEEGELLELEDQPDVDAGESDRTISEDQNYRDTVRGVRAFMGWNHIPDLLSGFQDRRYIGRPQSSACWESFSVTSSQRLVV